MMVDLRKVEFHNLIFKVIWSAIIIMPYCDYNLNISKKIYFLLPTNLSGIYLLNFMIIIFEEFMTFFSYIAYLCEEYLWIINIIISLIKGGTVDICTSFKTYESHPTRSVFYTEEDFDNQKNEIWPRGHIQSLKIGKISLELLTTVLNMKPIMV